MLPYNENLKTLSRQLRQNMTDAEKYLWSKIRMKQVKESQFYRQKPIGEYIVDFYCPKAKLVVEVDGSQHYSGETVRSDKVRDEYLKSIGMKVLRFTNMDILENINGAVERIESEIEKREIPLSPPLRKGEK